MESPIRTPLLNPRIPTIMIMTNITAVMTVFSEALIL